MRIEGAYWYRRSEALIPVLVVMDYRNVIVRRLLKFYKYGFAKSAAEDLGIALARGIDTEIKKSLVTFVPLHSRRRKWRSFNQAEQLAKEMAKCFGMTAVRLLNRDKETISQAMLNKEERAKNLHGAFSLSDMGRRMVKGAKVVIVDDVLTTGITLGECARVLKAYGAKEVIGVVVAKNKDV